jgi:hypothetical protein
MFSISKLIDKKKWRTFTQETLGDPFNNANNAYGDDCGALHDGRSAQEIVSSIQGVAILK